MDEDFRVGQCKALALCAAGQQERAHGGRHADTDGGDIALDVVHRVMDGHAVGDRAAGTVDIKVDILLRILAFKVQKLCHDNAGGGGVDVLAQHNDTVIEQAGENVIAALTARSLLDNIGYKAHWVFPPWCHKNVVMIKEPIRRQSCAPYRPFYSMFTDAAG